MDKGKKQGKRRREGNEKGEKKEREEEMKEAMQEGKEAASNKSTWKKEVLVEGKCLTSKEGVLGYTQDHTQIQVTIRWR